MKNSSHFESAKAITALFIVLVGFGVFMLFYNNSDTLLQGDGFYPFITLTVIGFSLLIGLLYLVNNSKRPRVNVQRSSVRKHKKVRSRK